MKNLVVNSLWIGKSLSCLEVLSIKSHLKQGHEYHLWSYNSLENIPDGVVIEDGNDILPENQIFTYQIGEGKGGVSAFSNLFRYKLLAERGGWWVDTDVIALRPFIFDEPFVFASERNRNGSSSPTTCVIGCDSPSHVLRNCYEMAIHLLDVSEAKLKWGSLGPDLFRSVLFNHDLVEYMVLPEIFCPVNWFDAELDPQVHNPPDISRSYAVHLWQEMWRRRGIDKNAEYDSNCLFERLKRDIL